MVKTRGIKQRFGESAFCINHGQNSREPETEGSISDSDDDFVTPPPKTNSLSSGSQKCSKSKEKTSSVSSDENKYIFQKREVVENEMDEEKLVDTYRSSLDSMFKIMKIIRKNNRLSKIIVDNISVTPFWRFARPFFDGNIFSNEHRKCANNIDDLVKSYSVNEDCFVIGKCKIKMTSLDISVIFGFPLMGKNIFPIKRSDKSFLSETTLQFVKRNFGNASVIRKVLIEKAIKKAIETEEEVLKKDIAALLILLLFTTFFFPNTQGSIPWSYLTYAVELKEMKTVSWPATLTSSLKFNLEKYQKTPRKTPACVMAILYWFCEHVEVLERKNIDMFLYPRFTLWKIQDLKKIVSSSKLRNMSSNKVSMEISKLNANEKQLLVEESQSKGENSEENLKLMNEESKNTINVLEKELEKLRNENAILRKKIEEQNILWSEKTVECERLRKERDDLKDKKRLDEYEIKMNNLEMVVYGTHPTFELGDFLEKNSSEEEINPKCVGTDKKPSQSSLVARVKQEKRVKRKDEAFEYDFSKKRKKDQNENIPIDVQSGSGNPTEKGENFKYKLDKCKALRHLFDEDQKSIKTFWSIADRGEIAWQDDTDIVIFGSAIEDLLFNQYIDGEVIDYCMKKLQRKYPYTMFVKTTTVHALYLGNDVIIKRFAEKMNEFIKHNDSVRVFFPLCQLGHWTLLEFDWIEFKWNHYNSLNPRRIVKSSAHINAANKVKEMVWDMIAKNLLELKRVKLNKGTRGKLDISRNCAQQKADSNDCALMIVEYMIDICENNAVTSNVDYFDFDEVRAELACEILSDRKFSWSLNKFVAEEIMEFQ